MIRFEGRAIPAREGQSLAAALTAAGVLDLRDTRRGPEGRGLYCGMGSCQDCVMVVDGLPNRRACMTTVAPGMVVQRQPHPAPIGPREAGTPPIGFTDLPEETPDLLVIGGGAGGLSAAIAARGAGLDVLLVDERSTPGGQYYKQPAPGHALLDAQQREGAELLRAAQQAGARILGGVEVWGAFAPLLFLATQAGRTLRLRPRTAIIATGAYERAVPFPGWTLPGVMTTGAAQTLWRSHRTLPGARVLVAGNGPLNLQVALELAAGGGQVVAVAEAAHGIRPAALARMAAASPALAAKGVAMLAALRRRGIPLLRGTVLHRVTRDGALHAELSDGRRFAVDAVLCGHGFAPEDALLRAFETEGHPPNLFAVGDATGLGGAPAAREEGRLAGLAAARLLGHAVPEDRAAQRRLARHRAFQAALWQVFRAPFPGLSLATADTILCRCEEVTLGEVEAALPCDLGALKRRTRCGMGRCQGRACAPLLADLLGTTVAFAPRAPTRPVRISDLTA
ncbi:FAD-dependent oxidoreductase [Falsiroseomonas sp. E2-1-a20]|uniref:FAD-dependent oxidoreductase n=1 Tax=Falsiroseomonas sp. E2-1-a20 TaxID=3239300 RepID=UPI003F2B5D6C